MNYDMLRIVMIGFAKLSIRWAIITRHTDGAEVRRVETDRRGRRSLQKAMECFKGGIMKRNGFVRFYALERAIRESPLRVVGSTRVDGVRLKKREDLCKAKP